MQTSLEKSIIFKGSEHRFRNFLFFIIMIFLFITLGFVYSSMDTNTFSINMFIIFEMVLGCFLCGITVLVYKVEKRSGSYNYDSYQLIIGYNFISSKKLNQHKKIYAENMKRIKLGRCVGGTGTKIKIWPKDYDKLVENGFKFGEGVLEYYKKHGTPVVLYPPALSRKERKRLRAAIEELK